MVRTQIYLTEPEQRSLRSLSKTTGQNQSELIRCAIDEFLSKSSKEHRRAILRNIKGLWKNRTDIPDVRSLREGWKKRAS